MKAKEFKMFLVLKYFSITDPGSIHQQIFPPSLNIWHGTAALQLPVSAPCNHCRLMTLQCCSAAASARMHNIKLVPASHYYLLEPDTQDPGHWLLAPGDTVQGAWWRFRSGDRESLKEAELVSVGTI